ncbi:glutamate racemase [Psychrobacter vallis]|uniref:glutamate racemase n=1 Tax=Psychrobacter vallis TaxID=248451 RepID=UPI00191A5D9C|nr:glutamate racemase [Psychrobacter vallis]
MGIATGNLINGVKVRTDASHIGAFDNTAIIKSDVNKKADNTVISHKDRRAPIGLFDSGIGGLSVYLHLAQQLPAERYVYYADTLNVPYGSRDSADIETLTLTAVEWLCEQGCKLIVIACNSASAYALEAARRRYPQVPIVGLVPALKPAILASKSGRVAVLATKATLNGTLLNNVINNFAKPNSTIVTKYFDPQLVTWVEAGMPEQDTTALYLRQQLQSFANDGIDQLVLGCTHYPFFKAFLLDEIAQQQLSMQVVDSGQAIAERVKQLLVTNQLSAFFDDGKGNSGADNRRSEIASETNVGIRPPLTFYATKYDEKLGILIERLLGKETILKYYTK